MLLRPKKPSQAAGHSCLHVFGSSQESDLRQESVRKKVRKNLKNVEYIHFRNIIFEHQLTKLPWNVLTNTNKFVLYFWRPNLPGNTTTSTKKITCYASTRFKSFTNGKPNLRNLQKATTFLNWKSLVAPHQQELKIKNQDENTLPLPSEKSHADYIFVVIPSQYSIVLVCKDFVSTPICVKHKNFSIHQKWAKTVRFLHVVYDVLCLESEV